MSSRSDPPRGDHSRPGLGRDELARALGGAGLDALGPEHASLFASAALVVPRRDIARMAEVVRAVDELVATPAYRDLALARAPEIARTAPAGRGVFFGYDFHLAGTGPQLIEVNTNAGGALLVPVGARAQRARFPEAWDRAAPPCDLDALEGAVVEMFRAEWSRACPGRPLARIVIVDDDPSRQFLYPEFVLFREVLRRAGIDAAIAAPGELAWRGGRLEHERGPVDLVYNRLTDFYLEEPGHAALREAYVAGACVVTPHPHAHALYANKHDLVLFADRDLVARAGVSDRAREVLAASVPAARRVYPEDADELWHERKSWFFKPAAGFGSKAAYRGDKLTRGTFASILAGDYVAQRIVPPSELRVEVGGAAVTLKVDVRNFAYGGRVQLVAARLYSGQTTNFRTPGGGFAAVLTEPR